MQTFFREKWRGDPEAFDEDQTDQDQTQEVVRVRALIPSAEEEEGVEVEVLEIKNIFINMLKNSPLSNEIIQGFYKLLSLELNYSQEKLDFVVQCFKNVYQMLDKSMENIRITH